MWNSNDSIINNLITGQMIDVWWSISMVPYLALSNSFFVRCWNQEQKRSVLRFEVVNISRCSMFSNSLSTRVPIICSRITDAGKKMTQLKMQFYFKNNVNRTHAMNQMDLWHRDGLFYDLRKFRHGFCSTCRCSKLHFLSSFLAKILPSWFWAFLYY